MSLNYRHSDAHQKLSSIQTILRYLLRRTEDNSGEQGLDETLFMVDQIEDIMKQLGALKGILTEKAFAEMMQLNIAEIDTQQFVARQVNTPSRVQVDTQGVADELAKKILEKELKRNKRLNPIAVRSIVNATFWSVLESGTIRWNKTKLKKQGISLEDHSEEGKEQHKIEIKKK